MNEEEINNKFADIIESLDMREIEDEILEIEKLCTKFSVMSLATHLELKARSQVGLKSARS